MPLNHRGAIQALKDDKTELEKSVTRWTAVVAERQTGLDDATASLVAAQAKLAERDASIAVLEADNLPAARGASVG